MSSFLILVGFEYRKIFCRKYVLVAILLTLTASLLNVWGSSSLREPADGSFTARDETAAQDRDAMRALSRRTLDATLLLEASAAYAALPQNAPPPWKRKITAKTRGRMPRSMAPRAWCIKWKRRILMRRTSRR